MSPNLYTDHHAYYDPAHSVSYTKSYVEFFLYWYSRLLLQADMMDQDFYNRDFWDYRLKSNMESMLTVVPYSARKFNDLWVAPKVMLKFGRALILLVGLYTNLILPSDSSFSLK